MHFKLDENKAIVRTKDLLTSEKKYNFLMKNNHTELEQAISTQKKFISKHCNRVVFMKNSIIL